MSHRRSAHTSPRRAPVATATSSQHANSASDPWAVPRTRRTRSTPGGVIDTRDTAGRVADETGLQARRGCGRAIPIDGLGDGTVEYDVGASDP